MFWNCPQFNILEFKFLKRINHAIRSCSNLFAIQLSQLSQYKKITFPKQHCSNLVVLALTHFSNWRWQRVINSCKKCKIWQIYQPVGSQKYCKCQTPPHGKNKLFQMNIYTILGLLRAIFFNRKWLFQTHPPKVWKIPYIFITLGSDHSTKGCQPSVSQLLTLLSMKTGTIVSKHANFPRQCKNVNKFLVSRSRRSRDSRSHNVCMSVCMSQTLIRFYWMNSSVNSSMISSINQKYF